MLFRPIIYIGVLLSAACTCRPTGPNLQTGDLLFQCGTGAMTEAIVDATGREETLDFTHVGIALHGDRCDSVLEATTGGGVRIIALAEFLDHATHIGGKSATVAMMVRESCWVCV